MARKCMMRREDRRTKLRNKHEAVRKELRAKQLDPNTTAEEMMAILAAYKKLPKDSSSTRRRNRCWQTGRANGVYRIVGLCRNKFRELCMSGYLPGIVKASW